MIFYKLYKNKKEQILNRSKYENYIQIYMLKKHKKCIAAIVNLFSSFTIHYYSELYF